MESEIENIILKAEQSICRIDILGSDQTNQKSYKWIEIYYMFWVRIISPSKQILDLT